MIPKPGLIPHFIFSGSSKIPEGNFILPEWKILQNQHSPVLFISNHMSTLETMIFPCIIQPLREVTFVVKESLVKHPLFGDVMRSRNPIVVGRTDPRKDLEAVMNGGAGIAEKGHLNNYLSPKHQEP